MKTGQDMITNLYNNRPMPSLNDSFEGSEI